MKNALRRGYFGQGLLFNLFIMNRKECIEMLIDFGAEDLTSKEYPHNDEKRFFKLRVGKVTPITFRFDYVEYKEAFVHSRRKNISKRMTFDEIGDLLISLESKILKNEN